MANLGSIGRVADGLALLGVVPNGSLTIRAIRLSVPDNQVFGYQDGSDGTVKPCMTMNAYGRKRILWPVSAGAITLSVQVKQASNTSPRPRMIIKKNTAIGISSDQEGVAGSSTTWTTISVSVTPTKSGVLEIYLENRIDHQLNELSLCKWDTLTES